MCAKQYKKKELCLRKDQNLFPVFAWMIRVDFISLTIRQIGCNAHVESQALHYLGNSSNVVVALSTINYYSMQYQQTYFDLLNTFISQRIRYQFRKINIQKNLIIEDSKCEVIHALKKQCVVPIFDIVYILNCQ